MYVRLEFSNDASREFLTGIPNGTCLTSTNAVRLYQSETLIFWYLDENVLNKHYGGVEDCLGLRHLEGVKSFTVIPELNDVDVKKLMPTSPTFDAAILAPYM